MTSEPVPPRSRSELPGRIPGGTRGAGETEALISQALRAQVGGPRRPQGDGPLGEGPGGGSGGGGPSVGGGPGGGQDGDSRRTRGDQGADRWVDRFTTAQLLLLAAIMGVLIGAGLAVWVLR